MALWESENKDVERLVCEVVTVHHVAKQSASYNKGVISKSRTTETCISSA